MQKLSLFLKISFVVYLALFCLSLLDYQFIDAIDYGQHSPVVVIFPFGIAMLFLACIILGMIILLSTREPRPETSTVKWLMALPYAISPIPIAIIAIFMDSNVSESEEIFFASVFVACVLLVVISAYSIYAYSLFWSKAKKVAFGIFQSLMGLAMGLVVLVVSFFGMHDGSLS